MRVAGWNRGFFQAFIVSVLLFFSRVTAVPLPREVNIIPTIA